MSTNNSGLSRRAALRQQQEQEARQQRNRKVLGVVLGAVALAVVVILGFVVWQTVAKNDTASGDQLTPAGATEAGGINLPSQGTEPAADVPHLVIFEDYQCPACAAREEAYGKAILELVDTGKITVEINTLHMLDDMLQNDSSERAAMASAAAAHVGKFREFHSVVYQNQPEEGVGYTDQQLRVDFPTQAGITGEALTTYQQLYDAKSFDAFITKADDRAAKEKVGSTPTFKVGDKELKFYDQEKQQVLIQNTADDLLRAITEANSGS